MAVADLNELTAQARKRRATSLWMLENDSQPVTEAGMILTQFTGSASTRDGYPVVQAPPTTATALSYSTHPEYSIRHQESATGDIFVGSVHNHELGSPSNYSPTFGMLIDLLSIQGGLTYSVSTSQTTNLPTATLPTRATGGEGVWMAYNAYDATSTSTDHNITISYTNQSATAGRTSTLRHTSTPNDGDFAICPLEAGDTGVRSIESVQLSAAAGTGSFGFILFRPLLMIPELPTAGLRSFNDLPGWNTPIDPEAVLTFVQSYHSVEIGQGSLLAFNFFEA